MITTIDKRYRYTSAPVYVHDRLERADVGSNVPLT